MIPGEKLRLEYEASAERRPFRRLDILLCILAIPFVFPTWWMVTSSVKPISDIFAFPPDIVQVY